MRDDEPISTTLLGHIHPNPTDDRQWSTFKGASKTLTSHLMHWFGHARFTYSVDAGCGNCIEGTITAVVECVL